MGTPSLLAARSPILTLVLREGSTGCRAECREFGIGIGAPSVEIAEYGLYRLVLDHCHTILSRNGTSSASKSQFALAQEVVKLGFTFRRA